MRGRLTCTRRPPSVSDPSWWPCRFAERSGLCLPFAPTTSSTSSSISSCTTPSPTPTLSRRRGRDDLRAEYLLHWRFLLSSQTWLAPVTLATRTDGAGEPPPKLLRDSGQPLRSSRRASSVHARQRIDVAGSEVSP